MNNLKRNKMTSERIKEIQEQTAYPESRSVMLALKQVWNECEQDKNKYSEEEVLEILKTLLYNSQMGKEVEDVNLWFEQFKKK